LISTALVLVNSNSILQSIESTCRQAGIHSTRQSPSLFYARWRSSAGCL